VPGLPRIRLPLLVGAAAVASAAVALPVAHSIGGCTPVPVNPPSGYYASEADETCGVKESHAKPVAGTAPREHVHVRIRWRYGYGGWGYLRLHSANAAARDMPGVVPEVTSQVFRRLGRLVVAIVSDPKRFPDAQTQDDTLILRSGRTYFWVLDEPGYDLTVGDLRDWTVGCACGHLVQLTKGTVGALLGHQAGELPNDPDSITWLDGTGRRWSVMAPEGAVDETRLLALANAVRSVQPYSCLPLFGWCA